MGVIGEPLNGWIMREAIYDRVDFFSKNRDD